MTGSSDRPKGRARESDNGSRLTRRGYLFVTADPTQVPMFIERAREAAERGVGPARIHRHASSDYQPPPADGFEDQPTGTDVITDPTLVRRYFPHLASDTVAVLHARRCGWFSAQQLGMYLLERAREHGVRLLEGRLERVDTTGGRVRGVQIAVRGGNARIATPRFVNAAGPFVGRVGRLLGLELPVFCERHAKAAFNDSLGAVPRWAPMTIWTDPITLPWSEEERRELSASAEHKRLVEEFPAGVHRRPEGGGGSPGGRLIWSCGIEPVEPTFPIAFDDAYGEICLRGMSRMIPALSRYLDRLPRVVVDGGHYPETRENRLLSGPLPIEGAYVLGALSGYGLMSSNGAADLLADNIADRKLPRYAPPFLLSRYDDPAYRALVEQWGDSGQL